MKFADKKEEPVLGDFSSRYGWVEMSSEGFYNRMQVVYKVFEELKKKHKFDAIAFTGSSGCAIGFALAMAFKIPLIYVRKENERSHGCEVECNSYNKIKKYLIVDDFVSSGETVRKIVNGIKGLTEAKGIHVPQPVGVLCFKEYSSSGKVVKNVEVNWKSKPEKTVRIPVFGVCTA